MSVPDDAQESEDLAVLRRDNQRLRDRAASLVDRALRLQRLTGRLSGALAEAEVAQVVVDEGTDALGAVSAALWALDVAGASLVLLRAHNYPDAALALIQTLPLAAVLPITDAARTGQSVWLESRAAYEQRYPESAARTRSMGPATSYSTAALPVAQGGAVAGALVFTFDGDRAFDDDERSFLQILAWHCAQGFERARLYAAEHAARAIAEAARERAAFLAEASALLGGSLEYEQTLRNVAQLAVPHLADWCAIELVDAELGSRQVAVAHVDPAKVELALELRRRYPPDRSARSGVHNVLRTGVSELLEEIPDAMLVAATRDAEHLRLVRELGLRSAIVAPIRNRGVIVGVITFIRSSSERCYGRDDVMMAEQLGERAGAAIENARLYEAAQRAICARDEFLAIAGHELRTPVAAISLHHESLLRLVEDSPVIAKVKERAAKLLAQSNRLGALISTLLDVSRVSAGRIELDREELDLAELCREVVERTGDNLTAAATLRLTTAPAYGSWDRARLDQVVTNLINNALKYGEGQPVDVQVEVSEHDARVIITDRGVGVAAADQRRIFERFERGASARHIGGLGLGLWIVRELVEAHGGTIVVTSTLGEGATFTVTLPRRPR